MSSKLNLFFPDFCESAGFPCRPVEPLKWRDGIMVRSPNWLGDAVMTFPALRQLHALMPQYAGVMVVCPEGFASLYQALDCVDDVIPLKDAHSFPPGKEMRCIKHMNPGAGLLFTNSFRDALIFRRGHVPDLRGTPARFRSLLMAQTFSFPPRRDRILNLPHQAVKYLSMAYAFGAPRWDGLMPAIKPSEPPGRYARTLLLRKEPVLLLAPGAAYGDAKRWAPENFRKTAEWWIKQGGVAAALGSGKERSAAEGVLRDLPQEMALNLAGQTSIPDLLHIFRHAKFAVANDSGLMHLAAASGLPGIAVFGSTDPAATSPLSPEWTVLYEKQECSPCFRRICPDGSKRCFHAITPDRVIGELRSACERLHLFI